MFCGVLIFVCRRAVLRKWKEKEGLHATYGNLLRVCCEGGDTSTAQVICHTLREKTKEEGKYSTTCIPTTLLVDPRNLCPIQHLFIGTTN